MCQLLDSPVFVYCSAREKTSEWLNVAKSKGCRLVDIDTVGATVHGGNPCLVIYDVSADAHTIHDRSRPDRFLPPKNTGVCILHESGKHHVRALPDPIAFIEKFFGKKPDRFNGFTGNFRVTIPI